MKAILWILLGALAAIALPGCMVVPKSELNAANTQNRALAEQNRAQLAEIENLKVHSRTIEDRLIRSEEQLARLQERANVDKRQLADYQRERDQLYDQFKGLAFGRGRLPPELSSQLAELSRKHPNLQFDPETGISKLDSDILFDSGEAVLKPGAGQLLDDLVRVMKSPAAGDLKIMVAGHTDNQLIAGRGVRDKYPNNFHLSTARALAVADRMKRAGLPEQRMAVAGFGPYQPVASNTKCERTPEEPSRRDLRHGVRRAGRRLERFNAERIRRGRETLAFSFQSEIARAAGNLAIQRALRVVTFRQELFVDVDHRAFWVLGMETPLAGRLERFDGHPLLSRCDFRGVMAVGDDSGRCGAIAVDRCEVDGAVFDGAGSCR